MSIVGVTRSTYSEVSDKIQVAIQRGGGIEVSGNEKVVVKINLCDFRTPESGAVTHPVFLDAFLNYLTSVSDRLNISIVESDATVARPDKLVNWLGIRPIIAKHHVNWVNLSKDTWMKKPIQGRHFHEIDVPQVVADSDYLITMPKLKTHLLTKVTASLKNQYGCIPYPRKIRFHPFLDDAIVDANLAMKPNFCIVDGILGMGGVKGPDLGVPIRSDVIITGKDPVSVDTVCAKIMNLNPSTVGHIRKAEQAGLGQMSFQVIGDALDGVKTSFEFNSTYAWVLRSVRSLK